MKIIIVPSIPMSPCLKHIATATFLTVYINFSEFSAKTGSKPGPNRVQKPGPNRVQTGSKDRTLVTLVQHVNPYDRFLRMSENKMYFYRSTYSVRGRGSSLVLTTLLWRLLAYSAFIRRVSLKIYPRYVVQKRWRWMRVTWSVQELAQPWYPASLLYRISTWSRLIFSWFWFQGKLVRGA